MLCLPPKWWLVASLSVAAVFVVFAVAISVVKGRGDFLILGWALIFPLGYYFLSYPEVHPVITLDRVFIGLLMGTACSALSMRALPIPSALRRIGLWWSVFLFFAAITIPRTRVPLNSLRTLLDGFLFPAFLAWFAFRYLDVRRYLPTLHVITCVMAIYVCGIGVAEIALQRDLLVMPDSAVFLAGDYNDSSSQIVIRPNGPFSTTNSFALIGLTTFFVLPFLRGIGPRNLPWWRAWLHRLALGAALMTGVMPMFRSVFLSLAVILLIDTFYARGRGRTIRVGALSLFLLIALGVRAALPAVFEERSAPGNVFGRLAEQQQVLAMFADHPLNGIGLNNFFYEASQKGKYTAFFGDVQSVDYPHNNLGAVLAETGLTGFIPFVVSQVLLVIAFCQVRRSATPESTLIWKCFLYIFLAYWINGMSLTSGYYSDLNLWYMLAFALMLKFAATHDRGTEPLLPAYEPYRPVN